MSPTGREAAIEPRARMARRAGRREREDQLPVFTPEEGA